MHLVAILIRKMMRSTEMPNLWIPFSNWQNGLIGDASTEWRCSYKWVEAQLQIRCRVRVVAGRPAVSKSLLKPRSSTSAEQIRVKPSYIVFSSSSSSSSLLSLISPPDELWSAGHKSVLTEHLLKCLGWSNLPLRTNICTPNPLYLLIFKKNKEKETICI